MLRNILHIILYSLILVGMVCLIGFSARHQHHKPCSNVNINIRSNSGNFFIHNAEIRNSIIGQFDSLENRTLSPNIMSELHEFISNNPYVSKANVYRTVHGKIGIDIILRDPIIRIVNSRNQSFYIDRDGYMFPLSDQHTARVMIATGHIAAPFIPGFHVTDTIAGGQTDKHLSGLFDLAGFIDSESFWKAFIDHIYVTADGKYELTPRNAAHTIQFGNANQIEHKFRKLKLFYIGNLAQRGWHYYRRINLEFNNQVICSK